MSIHLVTKEGLELAPTDRTCPPGSLGDQQSPAFRQLEALAAVTDHVDLAPASTAVLAQQFSLQQARFRQGLPVDERAGLELFRRAIEQRDECAWELLYLPCRALLVHWLLHHPWADRVLQDETPDSFVLEALSKFWQATARTHPFQERHSTLADILAYLRRCLHSVVLDAARRARMRQEEVSVEALTGLAASGQDNLSGEELWKCIERALPDQRERWLLYLRYVLDYRPREVVALAPDAFPSVELVYQLERKILHRLRRHPALTRWKA